MQHDYKINMWIIAGPKTFIFYKPLVYLVSYKFIVWTLEIIAMGLLLTLLKEVMSSFSDSRLGDTIDLLMN